MATYALLGSTGQVGSTILSVLLENPRLKIHAYARSSSKLNTKFPSIDSNPNVNIFEGSLDDTKLLVNCLRGTRAAFLAVAATGNQPGCSIAIDTAKNVVKACEALRREGARVPRLIVLSSASTEHRLMAGTPPALLKTLYTAFQHIYDDLKAAEAYLRSRDDLVSCTFVKPGALSDDVQRGHEISLEKAQTPVSYLDLAAGMVEIAEDEDGRFDMKSVAVNSAHRDEVAFPWQAPVKLVKGLLVWLFPWLWKWIG